MTDSFFATIEFATLVWRILREPRRDTPIDVVRTRLERRNANLPPYNFHIDPETLQGFLGLFERPSPDEGVEVVAVRDVWQSGANALLR